MARRREGSARAGAATVLAFPFLLLSSEFSLHPALAFTSCPNSRKTVGAIRSRASSSSRVVASMGFNPFSASEYVDKGDEGSLSAELADALSRISELEGQLADARAEVRRKESERASVAAEAVELKVTIANLRSELQRVGGGVTLPDPGNAVGGFFQMMEARRVESDARKAEAAAAKDAYAAAKKAEAAAAKGAYGGEGKKDGAKSPNQQQKQINPFSMTMKRAEADKKKAKAVEAQDAYVEAKKAEANAAKRAYAEARKLPFESFTLDFDKKVPSLNDWQLEDDGVVTGTVSNHPNIADGTVIVTSTLSNPSAASAKAVVETISGSKYRLGKPLVLKSNYGAANKKASVSKKAFADLGLEFSGEVAGDGKYLLAEDPRQSPSKRSKIYTAYQTDDRGVPRGKALAIKVSPNQAALEQENRNYQQVAGGFSRWKDYFIRRFEFLPKAGTTPQLLGKGALVMELGKEDLKEHLERQGKGLEGRELRDAAKAAAKCVEAVHACGLVWTDLKTENFLYVEDSENGIVFKGIDLESARKKGTYPVDYSPEACPPEFAEAFLAGEVQDFTLDYSYDIWSLGVFMYELCTGSSQFDGKTPIEITKYLPDYQPTLDDIPDARMKDLISQCLQKDPKKRPSSTQVLLHPYFLTTKLGFF